MDVKLRHVAKRYAYNWIVKDFNYDFSASTVYAIAGANGSGKSTLMKMISGYLTPSEGKISYTHSDKDIPVEQLYHYMAFVAPYTDVILEYSLSELWKFHRKFRKMYVGPDFGAFVDLLDLPYQKGKAIQFYSSGMKQKVQLALAILSDTPLLLLDEPTSYLDDNAKTWFLDLLKKFETGRTIIISSNDDTDFHLTTERIELSL